MAKTEAELRREAVRRRLAGESPAEIARSLGRTRQWVAKWVRRRETAGTEEWAAGAKRGPARAPSRTPAETEALVLAVRERLVANPWAQVGAEAIAWELRKLGVEPPPRRTIERIVARGGAPRRRGNGRRQPKGVPYPAVAVERPGGLHEADLVGPRHLQGGVRFYALNATAPPTGAGSRSSRRTRTSVWPRRSSRFGAGWVCPSGSSSTTAAPLSPPRGSA